MDHQPRRIRPLVTLLGWGPWLPATQARRIRECVLAWKTGAAGRRQRGRAACSPGLRWISYSGDTLPHDSIVGILDYIQLFVVQLLRGSEGSALAPAPACVTTARHAVAPVRVKTGRWTSGRHRSRRWHRALAWRSGSERVAAIPAAHGRH